MTLALIFSFLAQTVQADYCTASGGCDEYIYQVQVGTINNNVTGCGNYTDYTSSYSTVMEAGTGYSITVVTAVDGTPYAGYEGDKCGIWVDWNQDGDFYDINETVYSADGYGLFTTTITPPADALSGDTRMRVRLMYTGYGETLGPCGTTQFGEVEDYTINVTGAPSFVTISGYVKTSSSTGIKDVLMSASSGETDTTDVDGYYERTLSSPWSGTITPSKTDWSFEPAMREYTDLTSDVTNANFTGVHTAYGGGTGTADDPYLIFTASQMNRIGIYYVDWYSHFKLMADIDLGSYTGDSFNIIGGPLSKFRGVFDGNGKRIYNFTYTSVFPNIHLKGLFRHLDGANAEIKDLGLVNPNLNGGAGTEVGALVGRLSGSGSISGCSMEGGSVSGGSTVGGLVGLVENGTISNCYATCDVSVNNDYVGGLVGENEDNGTISNSYAKGTVSGDFYTGGLVGASHGAISKCYATGRVTGNYDFGGLLGIKFGSSVTDCFWDVNSSGQDGSDGGTGKTTLEMKTKSTFTSSGWDFVGETVNGPNDFWKICDGMNYPKLAWQIPLLGDFVCPDGVEMNDLAVLVEQWLLKKLSADISPDEGDGFVDFSDWAVFANAWQSTSEPQSANWNPKCDIAPEGGDGIVDMNDLTVFVNHWLQFSAYCADIAPEPDGDGTVNMLDFAILANNWLAGVE